MTRGPEPDLTPSQAQLVDAYKLLSNRNNRPPTLREMAEHLGLTYQAVHQGWKLAVTKVDIVTKTFIRLKPGVRRKRA